MNKQISASVNLNIHPFGTMNIGLNFGNAEQNIKSKEIPIYSEPVTTNTESIELDNSYVLSKNTSDNF